jgi:hypothetical protein
MMAASKKEVAKTKDQVPAYIKQGQGRGSENVGTEDVLVPRISILQALSPQIKKSDPQYIEGSEQGVIFNALTGELFPNGLMFVPVYFEKDHLVFRQRKAGGGLIRRCDSAQEAQELADTDETFEYIESPSHLVIICEEDGTPYQEAMIPMATSKQKVSRKLNSLVRMNEGDRFSRMYRLTAAEDESPSGEYWNFAVANAGFPVEETYLAAESLYESVSAGRARRADYSENAEY